VPQPRFWQLFEIDGTRNEVPRTDFEVFKKIPVRPDEFPAAFASAKGVYLQTPTADEGLTWVKHLKQLNPNAVVLWEPWEIFYTPENLIHFQHVAPYFDIISPQTVELSWMLGETDPQKQADVLVEYGVNCLALRLGVAGSLVGTAHEWHHIPALPAPVVDATGAGNAYCGGFIVGYVESEGNSLIAGRYGTVSATFTLAQVGVPHLGSDSRILAEAELQELKNTR
jgi:sugar/nucleoside kinase (ribokinase family)